MFHTFLLSTVVVSFALPSTTSCPSVGMAENGFCYVGLTSLSPGSCKCECLYREVYSNIGRRILQVDHTTVTAVFSASRSQCTTEICTSKVNCTDGSIMHNASNPVTTSWSSSKFWFLPLDPKPAMAIPVAVGSICTFGRAKCDLSTNSTAQVCPPDSLQDDEFIWFSYEASVEACLNVTFTQSDLEFSACNTTKCNAPLSDGTPSTILAIPSSSSFKLKLGLSMIITLRALI